MRAGELPRNEADHLQIDVEPAEGDRRYAVLSAQQGTYLVLGSEAQLDHVETEPAPVDFLGRECRLDLIRADAVLGDEQLPKSSGHGVVS